MFDTSNLTDPEVLEVLNHKYWHSFHVAFLPLCGKYAVYTGRWDCVALVPLEELAPVLASLPTELHKTSPPPPSKQLQESVDDLLNSLNF